MFGRANGGLRQIAALTGLARIVDCTLGTSPCTDPSLAAPSRSRHLAALEVQRLACTMASGR
eukprot:12383153-Alexandrium_andersonii.AAC.1